MDAGLFFQEEWRMRPELTLTAGMRYEVQNNIGDRRISRPASQLHGLPAAVAGGGPWQ
jgi:outer membrane receptor for ferrienterochelin and colicin